MAIEMAACLHWDGDHADSSSPPDSCLAHSSVHLTSTDWAGQPLTTAKRVMIVVTWMRETRAVSWSPAALVKSAISACYFCSFAVRALIAFDVVVTGLVDLRNAMESVTFAMKMCLLVRCYLASCLGSLGFHDFRSPCSYHVVVAVDRLVPSFAGLDELKRKEFR